jgi:hypothetical protein
MLETDSFLPNPVFREAAWSPRRPVFICTVMITVVARGQVRADDNAFPFHIFLYNIVFLNVVQTRDQFIL